MSNENSESLESLSRLIEGMEASGGNPNMIEWLKIKRNKITEKPKVEVVEKIYVTSSSRRRSRERYLEKNREKENSDSRNRKKEIRHFYGRN